MVIFDLKTGATRARPAIVALQEPLLKPIAFLSWLSKWRGLVVGRRMGEVEVVGRGGWGGALDGTKNRVRS